MANISFEEFYYNLDKQIHDLSEVQNEYEKNNGDISKYRGQMFCPECKAAELRFTHKTSNKRAFLSKIPSSSHNDGCSFIHEYASTNEVNQFIKTLSEKQIQDRLESTLNLLLPREEKDNCNIATDVISNPFVIEHKDKSGSGIRKALHRKSIRSWFDKSEENQVYIFYGRVKLKVEEVNTQKGIRFRLIVEINQGNNWITKTSIFRGVARDEIDENKIYDIAVLGCIEFYKGFPQIGTETFSSIMFRESKK